MEGIGGTLFFLETLLNCGKRPFVGRVDENEDLNGSRKNKTCNTQTLNLCFDTLDLSLDIALEKKRHCCRSM